jgi:hypothetical protein
LPGGSCSANPANGRLPPEGTGSTSHGRSEQLPERDLRPSVIHRKVIGGYYSQLGADVSAIFISVLTAARERGENLFRALCSVSGRSPHHAAGLTYFGTLSSSHLKRCLS